MDIKNHVAIVTGSGTGIGAAVALKLAGQGARVAVNYTKSLKEAEATLDAIKANGGEGMLAQGDVGNDDDCRRIAADVMQRWGRIDILVNNAGATVFADHANLDGLNADDFLRIYKINVVGSFQMIRAPAPRTCAPAASAASSTCRPWRACSASAHPSLTPHQKVR